MAQFDAIVVGTGFAGAVTACRLAQAGLRICVLERGRRYGPDDFLNFPAEAIEAFADANPGRGEEFLAPPDFARWNWDAGHGLWQFRPLGEMAVAQSAGYGGGSLIYANVHLRAPDAVFRTGWPEQYQREALDEYYDLAAYMLQVDPLPEALARSRKATAKGPGDIFQLKSPAMGLEREGRTEDSPLAKTVQFHNAVNGLERGGQLFRPPLAVRFEIQEEEGHGAPQDSGDAEVAEKGGHHNPLEENEFGRLQRHCDLRGQCTLGCRARAKNTLDFNYLALAEDARVKVGGGTETTCADIRTLAEVYSVERLADNGYRAHYYDHLRGGQAASVEAPHVFLCAGAVNTTELLMRSVERGDIEGVSPLLGEGFFPNADAFAMVFDTEEAHDAGRGPTITSAVRYQAPAHSGVGEDWFLIEDGGFPPRAEPLFGVFRSPLWLRRNRFAEADGGPTPSPAVAAQHFQLALRKKADIDQVLAAVGQMPRGSVRQGGLLAEILGRGGDAGLLKLTGLGPAYSASAMTEPTSSDWKSLPGDVVKALAADRKQLSRELASLAEPLVEKMLRETAKQLASTVGASHEGLSESEEKRKEFELESLVQWLLRLGVQITWGDLSALSGVVANSVLDEFAPKTPSGLLSLAVAAVSWALDYRTGGGHTGMLLAMGRDRYPGRLLLEPATRPLAESRLRVNLPAHADKTTQESQELLMRDIARTWKGELRTNPATALFRRHLTVHPQGGCAMADSATRGVTDPDGQVHGCEGLYVMDAAAFPGAVGVNPSATITAIAEAKVASYIRKRKEDPSWEAPQLENAREWMKEPGRRKKLDPDDLRHGPDTNAPGASPVGITFKERMVGHLAPLDTPEVFEPREELHRVRLRPYRFADRAGTEKGLTAETMLTAHTSDLGAFLRGTLHRLGVKGCVLLTAGFGTPEKQAQKAPEPVAGTRKFKVVEGSCIELFSVERPGRRRVESIRYELRLQSTDDPRERYVLDGFKLLRNDPGPDLWSDTTTQYFDLVKRENGKDLVVSRGILRLPAASFFDEQLSSIEARETTDLARRFWAVTSFANLFFDHLTDVYVPDLQRTVNVPRRVRELNDG